MEKRHINVHVGEFGHRLAVMPGGPPRTRLVLVYSIQCSNRFSVGVTRNVLTRVVSRVVLWLSGQACALCAGAPGFSPWHFPLVVLGKTFL